MHCDPPYVPWTFIADGHNFDKRTNGQFLLSACTHARTYTHACGQACTTRSSTCVTPLQLRSSLTIPLLCPGPGQASSELQDTFGLGVEENLVELFKCKLLQTYACSNNFTPAIQVGVPHPCVASQWLQLHVGMLGWMWNIATAQRHITAASTGICTTTHAIASDVQGSTAQAC